MSQDSTLVSADQYLGGLLAFLYRAVHGHLIVILILTMVAMALAFVAVQSLPVSYAAQATVRLGRVDAAELISQQAAAARINSPAFRERVLRSIQNQSDDGRASSSIMLDLAARPESSDALNISVQSSSDRNIQRVFDAIVSLLNEEQDKIRESMIADIKAQLDIAEENIATQLQIRDSLAALKKSVPDLSLQDPAGATRALWLLDLASRNERELAAAKAEQRALAARLGPLRTYPVSLVDGDFIQPVVVPRRLMTIMFLAGAVTFVACVLYLLLFPRRPSRGAAS